MIFIILAVILGVVIGLFLPVPANQIMSLYFVVGIFAALDSVLGAIRANLEKKYNSLIFISGFLTNSVVAMILAYVGDKLSLPLYYAAIFVFGVRVFGNISTIRRFIISKKVNKNNKTRNRRFIYCSSLEKRKKY